MKKIAIIGGTGMEDAEEFSAFAPKIISTPYGEAKCKIGTTANGDQLIFLSRHGIDHSVPPHKINYRANIWALKSLGTEEIFTTTAVGSLRTDYAIGDFIVLDNFLDFTKNRISTFYDGGERGVAHVNVTDPFCPRVRSKLISCLSGLGFKHHTTGTYVCMEGPRFETRAEIKMLSMLGGDVVGMTAIPEIVLAREAEMCYSSCAIVTNMGAGISDQPVSMQEVLDCMQASVEKMKKLFLAYLSAPEPDISCDCHQTMKEFGGFKL